MDLGFPHNFCFLGSINNELDPVQQAPPTADSEHEIPDVFTGLALAYNLQFPDIATNVTVSCLAGKAGAKASQNWLLMNNDDDYEANFSAQNLKKFILAFIFLGVDREDLAFAQSRRRSDRHTHQDEFG